ncbi:MAG: hypothetical protein KF685_05080 [Acidobacteria bacterium]|nr:hypothetical protein [Acidobacteriota bacterium]
MPSSNISTGNIAIIFLSLFVLACGIARGQNVERISLLVDYESGYGGAVYPVYNPYVFFKNGIVAKEPKVAIDEMDLKARSKDDALRWGTWKRSGGKVVITWDGVNRRGKQETKEADWPGYTAHPAGRNDTLEGAWSSTGGGGNIAFGGSVGVLTSKRFTFTRDGKFTTENLASTTGPNIAAYSKKNTAGRYKISGNVIELVFNSGDKRRLFFCYLGNDKKVMRIAGSNYTPATSSRRNRE